MAFYSRGAGDDVDDFDEYDPTPFGGGYDQGLTYGRPLPPSEETCYSISSSSGDAHIDYDRPSYSSYSHTSSAAYGEDYSQEDRYGAAHAFSSKPTQPSSYGGSPKPDYGFQPEGGMNRPTYESSEGDSGFGAYSGRPKRDDFDDRPAYGEDYPPPRRPQGEEEGYGFGSDRPGRYGEDYAPRPPPRQEQGYGFDSDRPGRYGDDDNARRQQGYGFESDRPGRYGQEDYPPARRHQEEFFESQRPTGYGDNDPPRRRPQEEESYGYQGSQEYGYGGGRSSYQQEEENEPRRYQKSSYDPDQEEGYGGRPKHGDDSDDEEKKRRHHKHHHHHRKYDDDE